MQQWKKNWNEIKYKNKNKKKTKNKKRLYSFIKSLTLSVLKNWSHIMICFLPRGIMAIAVVGLSVCVCVRIL